MTGANRGQVLEKRLEESFFQGIEEELVQELRRDVPLNDLLEIFRNTTGIRDRRRLLELANTGVRVPTLTAFSWLPLVFVAWADGHFDDTEKKAIIEGLVERGISRKVAAAMINHEWFRQRPDDSLWDTWRQYALMILDRSPLSLRNELMDEIVTQCHVVANAAGCSRRERISRKEWHVIDQVTRTLSGETRQSALKGSPRRSKSARPLRSRLPARKRNGLSGLSETERTCSA